MICRTTSIMRPIRSIGSSLHPSRPCPNVNYLSNASKTSSTTSSTRSSTRRHLSIGITTKQSPSITSLRAKQTTLTLEARSTQRSARKAAAQQAIINLGGTVAATADPSRRNNIMYAAAAFITLTVGWGVMDGDSPVHKVIEITGIKGVYDMVAKGFNEPHAKSLLPDWPMPNVPANIPCPPTLVLDLEETLVSATWSKKYGWRHAKRPGVDKFLQTMGMYYEIVLMSPSLPQNAEPVIASLDKDRYIMHHIFREGLHYIDGVHVKDLDNLNRPVNRIVVIDDDRAAVKKHPSNLIKVKPYTDPHDRSDDTLLKLIPILVEIAKSNTKDVPKVLRQFEGMDADEIAEEYNRRIEDKRQQQRVQSSSGLASFARGRDLPPPELSPQQVTLASKSGLTSKDLMGDVTGADKVEGTKKGIVGWYEERIKAKQEEQQLRNQKFQEIMQRREERKAQEE
eukprot:CAMPEP_0118649638 /NCGR_PEP_ID=MMETSP0785-20121206/9811_1 /TAXON_ID=91992 /ORGANISM="Bolidomonas pacifica, Strain CCMP 1866" /LENGTH=453 /DNA_ID=CAMNT_0006541941 /DNA_START=22 /DNA_END=1380 /DNA_ORIENTATION=+